MSNFLIVISAENDGNNTRLLFRNGVNIASKFLNYNSKVHVVETDNICAASFNRTNGSQLKIVKDPEKYYWLLATGTWFHDNNLASGDETSLLNCFLETNVIDVAKKLEGLYNIFIGNEKKNELYLITDIHGGLHCYERDFSGATVLSGSSAILAALDDWTLDPVTCQEFLYTGKILENRTFYNEVKRLAPASIHTFSEGKHKNSQRYWSVSDLEPDSIKGEYTPSLLYDSICNATKKIISVFKNPICDLTGGYDSRLVFSALISSGLKPATFVSGPSDSKDVKISRAIATEFNVPHFHFTKNNSFSFSKAKEVLKYTDGECDLFKYSGIFPGQMFTLNKGYNSNIIGSFGELARGYQWHFLYPNIGAFSPLDCSKFARYKYSSNFQYASLFQSELKIDLFSHFANVVEKTNVPVSHFPNTTQLDNNLLNMSMPSWYGIISSSTDKIRPFISPFQFRSVFETMLQIDWKFRNRNRLVREMLAKFQPRLANISLENGCPALPVKWNNFFRFFPMINHNCNRALSHIRRRLTGPKKSISDFDSFSLRGQIWDEEEVKEILDPSKMKAGKIMDLRSLSTFLNDSQKMDFTYIDQFKRLLSLEHCLQVLDSIRYNIRPD